LRRFLKKLLTGLLLVKWVERIDDPTVAVVTANWERHVEKTQKVEAVVVEIIAAPPALAG
jgi:hypothetical protein